MVILWDKQRPLPRYAKAYCAMLTDYVREIFPITRPTVPTRDIATMKTHAQRVRAPGIR
jgi:hypothetical protein